MTCERCNSTGIIIYGGNFPQQCSNCIGPKYAGIGARETPLQVTQQMTQVAMQLAMRGWVLRSGRGKRPAKPAPDTDSADLAFERGVDLLDPTRKVIRTATGGSAAMTHAAGYHPNWGACDEYARALHARNSLVMLGDWLDDPVRFVLCWTPDGAVKGGTGQALRIAAVHGIPVFNFAVTPVAAFWEWFNVQ